MAKIVWLASYPKSGNTWVRVLLTNYLRKDDQPADINKLEGGPIASARFWFDEWVGVEASALDDTVVERLRPRVYRCMSGDSPETLYMKVHDAWARSDLGEALFPSDVTAGVVYIIRNPLDMAASFAHHGGVSTEKAVDDMCNPNFTIARSLGGLADQLRQKLSSWSGHVQSWLDASGLPCRVVRYEDLRSDPETVFAGVVRFCGLPFDEDSVRKAVAFSEFSELQKQELSKGFHERGVRATSNFFRRGCAGAWRDDLSADQVDKLIRCHEQTMRRFGYIDAHGEPV
jgi:aryl sulfotransferase